MKKIFTKLLVLLVVVASGMVLTGCEKNNAKNIVGKWKLVSVSQEIKIGDQVVESGTGMLTYSLIYVFNSDGTLEQITDYGEGEVSVTGLYTLDNNKLILRDPTEPGSLILEVKELTAKKLVLTNVETETEEGKIATITSSQEFEKMN